MGSSIIMLLVVWLGFNAAFVAIRLYATANRRSSAERAMSRYPKLVN